jgi:hypothetical protein
VPATVSQAVNGVSVSRIKKEDPKGLKIVLGKLISELMVVYGIDFGKPQIDIVINQIITKYWYLKLEEIAYIFQKAISGQIKVYGALKVADILGWINDYDVNDRQLHVETEGSVHKESTDYFREQEHKESVEFQNKRKKLVQQFSAAADAKKEVDGN